MASVTGTFTGSSGPSRTPAFGRTAVVEHITSRGTLMPPVRASSGPERRNAWLALPDLMSPSRARRKRSPSRGGAIACRV
jgi:hypothetical protein